MRPRLIHPRRPRSAYTLAEVLVALGLASVLSAMVLSLVVSETRNMAVTSGKAEVDRALRISGSVLAKLAETADYMYVYDGYDSASALSPKGAGQSGDYAVFVYYNNPGNLNASGKLDTTVRRVVGIYRRRSTVATWNTSTKTAEYGGNVYMFDSEREGWGVDFPADKPALMLLPPASMEGKFKALLDTPVFASAQDIDSGRQRLFTVMPGNNGILVMGRIASGVAGNAVSAGCSFTVSSRNL